MAQLFRQCDENQRSLNMLTDRAVAYLRPLTFSKTAERLACFIPLGGIYWNDEIPDFETLMKIPEEDRNAIFKLFGIRFKIWGGADLEAAEKQFWEEARLQVPEFALFQRLKLSDEDRAAQEQVEKDFEEGFATLFDAADEVEVSHNDGVGTFSATFDLTKAKEPWWKRMFRR